jgi:hypothetical protein
MGTGIYTGTEVYWQWWDQWGAISNISKRQMGINSAFKGLNTIAKGDFYKCIQKLYDSANLCVQLEGMYVEN